MTAEKIRYTVLPRVLVFVFKDDKLLMMKYSGKGENMTQEKVDRKDIYNCIGGHVEKGEDVIETAVKEAEEEAGIKLLNPKVKGIINISGFAGKDIINFIVSGTTEDDSLQSTLEGDLEWVDVEKIKGINIFDDIVPILNQLLSLKAEEIFVGKINFDGKFKMLDISLRKV